MKQHSDIRQLFLPWIEQKLDDRQVREIEEHLSKCVSCQRYFDTMSHALTSDTSAFRATLIPDPFLAVRIRASSRASASVSPSGREFVVRWSLRTAAFVMAVVVGIYMGEKIASQSIVVTDQHIIGEYSDYFVESGIGDRLQTVALTSEEVSK